MRKWLIPILLLLACISGAQESITIRMMASPAMGIPPKEATDPRSQARRAVFDEFHRQNPDIRVVNAGGLELTGDRAESGFLMSMAGDTAPDVFYVNFRQYYNFVDQGFCRPLNDLIAKDPESMARVNPLIMEVLESYDGKIYAVPWYQVAMALYYRRDHFLEAGLDPTKPPKNWEEFYTYAQRLTESKTGRYGFVFGQGSGSRAYWWINFVWQAGGEYVEPGERGYWKSALDSDEAAVALDFYRTLVMNKWTGKDGKQYGPVANIVGNINDEIRNGNVSMWFGYTNDVLLNMQDLNAALLGIAALPAGPAGRKNEINAGMWAINAAVKDPKRLGACWRFIKYFSGEEAARVNTEQFIQLGMGNLVSPVYLRKFGHDDLLGQVDPAYVRANEEIFQTGHPEPYGRNVQQVYVVVDNALDRAVLEKDIPAREILRDVSAEMNAKLLGYTPPDVLEKQRSVARIVLVTVFLIVAVWIAIAWRRASKRTEVFIERLPAGISRSSIRRFMFWCILPAGGSIIAWAYYPLLRGLVIAFQDYRIVKGTSWVGLDNFIAVFTYPIFWRSLLNSFLYVALTLIIGFFLPIFLALALNEIPRFKVFFRTVFYLPAMTSGIVIAFLWRQFYDKTEAGLLNTILAPFINGINWLFHKKMHLLSSDIPIANDWLGNPTLALFAVVLPGIWAAAGPGSILYLAALKNVPEERYEAADLDGAGWFKKIRYITFPALTPLILINLLGVFIAGFKAMENIFILTGGGPLYATHTIGLEIWTNAFMFLKFGYATAAAWVMGSILIGFTTMQIKHLVKMRFTAAKI
ncbi:MAG: extracellular solute-binding protein [Fimbriimonadaceae bacterium]|nr:extracellular solute-binding protein [Fimbriimonadaceae bacterium]